jgi:biopolymer transport protein ExbB/TolQ
MNDFSTVATFFKEGGIFMYFMLATAVVVIAIAVERFIVVGRAAGLNGHKMADDLVSHVNRRDITAARKLSRMSDAPAAQVAAAMLQVADGDIARLHAAADDAATLALSPLSRRLPHLNVLANVATLLGLLGTISGLITAFSAVGAADPAQRSAFMAAGISTALNATAFGLIIAIPTLLIQGYLVGMVEGIAEQADEMSIRLAHALAEGAAGQTATHVLPMHAQRVAGGAPATIAASRSGMTAQGGGQ